MIVITIITSITSMISLKLNICGQEIFKVSFNLWENIDSTEHQPAVLISWKSHVYKKW